MRKFVSFNFFILPFNVCSWPGWANRVLQAQCNPPKKSNVIHFLCSRDNTRGRRPGSWLEDLRSSIINNSYYTQYKYDLICIFCNSIEAGNFKMQSLFLSFWSSWTNALSWKLDGRGDSVNESLKATPWGDGDDEKEGFWPQVVCSIPVTMHL